MKDIIGIDLTYLRDDRASGIRKHAEDILYGLKKIDNNKYDYLIFVYDVAYEKLKKDFPEYQFKVLKYFFGNIKYVRHINAFHIYKNIVFRKSKCKVIFHPFTDFSTALENGKINITSILDLNVLHLIQDKESLQYKETKNKYRKIINKSDIVTTLSSFVKNEIEDTFDISDKNKIVAIPCAVSKLEKTEKKASDILKDEIPYIFSINSFYNYKNQITLVKAFNIIKDKISCNLVLVGRPELDSPLSNYNAVIEYINSNNLNDRIKVLSNISDEERNTLFYNTSLFVSNSLFEGFGRTPVEAAMCSVPVITTRETSLPEVTLELVNYYNSPEDENELAHLILKVLNNSDYKEELNNISGSLISNYDVVNIAKKYIDVFDGIIKNKE